MRRMVLHSSRSSYAPNTARKVSWGERSHCWVWICPMLWDISRSWAIAVETEDELISAKASYPSVASNCTRYRGWCNSVRGCKERIWKTIQESKPNKTKSESFPNLYLKQFLRVKAQMWEMTGKAIGNSLWPQYKSFSFRGQHLMSVTKERLPLATQCASVSMTVFILMQREPCQMKCKPHLPVSAPH